MKEQASLEDKRTFMVLKNARIVVDTYIGILVFKWEKYHLLMAVTVQKDGTLDASFLNCNLEECMKLDMLDLRNKKCILH